MPVPAVRLRTPTTRLSAALLALVLILVLAWPGTSVAQQRVASEVELKVAFVYRVALFVEWPAESLPPAAAFRICVLGNDPAWTAAFATLEGKLVQGHAVAAPRLLAHGDEPRACHVLFVPEREGGKPPAPQAGLLTVGDAEGFAQAGGVVGLARDGARLRLDLNRDAATRQQLRLPAELLKIARQVIDGGGPR